MSAPEERGEGSSFGELLRSAGHDPARAGASLRSAILRALLCAAAFALVAAALTATDRGVMALTVGLFGGFLGLVAGAIAWFEGWLVRASDARHVHAFGAVLAGVGAALGSVAALAQAAYVVALREDKTVAAGLEEAQRLLATLGREPVEALALFGGFGLVFAAATFARVRRLHLVKQLLVALAGWLAAAFALGLALDGGDRRAALALSFACALFLPLLARAADALERRVWRDRV